MTFLNYVLLEYQSIFKLLLEHIQLTFLSVCIAVLAGIPLGVAVYHFQRLNKVIMGLVNLVQAIPSMALLGAAIPLLGIGKLPAIVVVALYSLLPIVKNTYTGIHNTPPEILEAAKGIGLTDFQRLIKVQLPLALPVIMAGVRIAAVTAVGLITIAAFIGAGGLGFLVFSGISTMNSNQILAGAIPACILALLVDYAGAIIEKRFSTKGKEKAKNQNPKALLGTARKKIAFALILLLSGTGFFLWQNYSPTNTRQLVVAGKNYTEQMLLPHLLAELIESNTDIHVERKISLGGTKVCFEAIQSGDIDMYVEYSGTAYGDILANPPITDMQEVYETVKAEFREQFGLTVLKQMAFNNTYTIATTPEIAEQYQLKNISDLQPIAKRFATAMNFEFLNRQDGLPGLSKHYDFTFGKANAMDAAQRYTALNNGDVQFIDAYSTDGLLKRFNLVILADDKAFFPPYYAMPVMRADIAQKNPELIPVIESLGDILTNSAMMELNYRVDELQENPRNVAVDFLRKQGLVP